MGTPASSMAATPTTPITSARWSEEESKAFEDLLTTHIDSENNDLSSPVGMKEMWSIISAKMQEKGFHRSANALQRRHGQRVKIRRSPPRTELEAAAVNFPSLNASPCSDTSSMTIWEEREHQKLFELLKARRKHEISVQDANPLRDIQLWKLISGELLSFGINKTYNECAQYWRHEGRALYNFHEDQYPTAIDEDRNKANKVATNASISVVNSNGYVPPGSMKSPSRARETRQGLSKDNEPVQDRHMRHKPQLKDAQTVASQQDSPAASREKLTESTGQNHDKRPLPARSHSASSLSSLPTSESRPPTKKPRLDSSSDVLFSKPQYPHSNSNHPPQVPKYTARMYTGNRQEAITDEVHISRKKVYTRMADIQIESARSIPMCAAPETPLDKIQSSIYSAETATLALEQDASTTKSSNAVPDEVSDDPFYRMVEGKVQADKDSIAKLKLDKENKMREMSESDFKIQAWQNEITAEEKIKEGKGMEIKDIEKKIMRSEAGMQRIVTMIQNSAANADHNCSA